MLYKATGRVTEIGKRQPGRRAVSQCVCVLVKVTLLQLHEFATDESSFAKVMYRAKEASMRHKSRIFMADGHRKAYTFEGFLRGGMSNPGGILTQFANVGASMNPASSRASGGNSAHVLASMAAYHAEFAQHNEFNTRLQQKKNRQRQPSSLDIEVDAKCVELKDNAEQIYDTMVIIVIGPHNGIRRQGAARHSVLGAAWPQDTYAARGR